MIEIIVVMLKYQAKSENTAMSKYIIVINLEHVIYSTYLLLISGLGEKLKIWPRPQ